MTPRALHSPALALLAGALCLLWALPAGANSSGPLDGKTGAPGEGNCTDCHVTFPLDSGDGSYGEACLPSAGYAPGDVYTLCIEIADPDAARWGFEFTIIDAAGEQAGGLSSLDANTQVSSSDVSGQTRQYAKHTSAGTFPGTPDGATWTVQWQAPPEGTGTVTLFGMGNAANNNNANSGDRIYSLVLELEEFTSTGVEAPALLASLQPNYPNPFNPKTTLSYQLQRPQSIRLSVHDASGRLVKVLEQGPMGAGEHRVVWDGHDAGGQPSPSGLYFARLADESGAPLDAARKLLLAK